MSPHRRQPSSATVALCLLFGCATGPVVEVAPPVAVADEFPGAARFFRGIETVSRDPDWRLGDEVLFGLRFGVGGRVERRLLHVVVDQLDDGGETMEWTVHVNGSPRSFASRRCRVTATVADQDGAVLAVTTPHLPWQTIAHGSAEACRQVEHALDAHADLAGTEGIYQHLKLFPLAQAVVSTMSLVHVAQHDSVLAPLLWQVVQRPSLWSVVTGLGVDVVVVPHFHRCRRVPGGDAADPRWTLPIDVEVNGALALSAELVVAAADPPRALCAGIVAATANHPSDPGRVFRAELLAARRGPTILVGAGPDQRSTVIGRDTALDKR